MWNLQNPKPVKLIIGILAADEDCLRKAIDALSQQFGTIDLTSEVWRFEQTDYYADETGEHILRQFVSFDKLVEPSELAEIKHKTNGIEQELARKLKTTLPRPVNLDPGIIETSKLILATTKNYSHRIYIGNKMYAEVTLIYDKGIWKPFDYTYPDYRQKCYHDFFNKVRIRLKEQLKSIQ
jgi:hypothetical protein